MPYILNAILQMENIALKNEVRRFVYSGPLTGQGIALKDVTAVTK